MTKYVIFGLKELHISSSEFWQL